MILVSLDQGTIERGKARPEDLAAPQVEPPFKDRRVHPPKVSVELRGVCLEVREARMRTPKPALDFAADDEHGRGCPVVGPASSVLRQCAAELREGHDKNRI